MASAVHRLDEARTRLGPEGVVEAHRSAWNLRWMNADVEVRGDDGAQRALRFAAYHLMSAANPDDPSTSIGARGLTGAAYSGHVFWDTDIFMLPFFVLTEPNAARALLSYRHRTLAAARKRAARFGYDGALYAWESSDTGDDVTPPFMIMPDGQVAPVHAGNEEHHISADVTYAVWHYWQATGDDAFMRNMGGAEIVLETARFWASRVTVGEDERYHILQVTGPDEYHETVDDNAYTNVMAQWNLERAVELVTTIKARWPDTWQALSSRVSLSPGEPARWQRIAERMYTGLDLKTGLFEQFRGYFALDDIDLRPYANRTAPLDIVLGHDRVRRSRIIKQADVVMLLFLLWDRFPPQVREANFRYYEPRAGHGSSLSPCIHATVAARLGYRDLAERYFRQGAEIDLADEMGNAAGGVHIGALGGLWQAAVFGFGGLELTADGPSLTPRLPSDWQRLAFSVQVRGRRFELRVPAKKGESR
jgi:kojibiose phosphorylase